MDQDEDRSFRLDRSAGSFRPSDFGLGDVPWLVVAFAVVIALVAGASYVLDPVIRILPLEWRPVIFGLVLGFLAGLRVSGWSSRRTKTKEPPPFTPET